MPHAFSCEFLFARGHQIVEDPKGVFTTIQGPKVGEMVVEAVCSYMAWWKLWHRLKQSVSDLAHLVTLQHGYEENARAVFGFDVFFGFEKPHMATHAPALVVEHGAGPYHSAQHSERFHKLTARLFGDLTNKLPHQISRQLAEATDATLSLIMLRDAETAHPFRPLLYTPQVVHPFECQIGAKWRSLCYIKWLDYADSARVSPTFAHHKWARAQMGLRRYGPPWSPEIAISHSIVDIKVIQCAEHLVASDGGYWSRMKSG